MAAVSRSRCRATRATRKGNKASHGPPNGFFSSPKRLADLPYGFFSSPKWLADLPYGFFGLQSGWRTSHTDFSASKAASHTDFSASKAVGGPPIRIFRPPKQLADLPYGFFSPASPFPVYSSPASWLKSSFEPLSSPRAACRSLSARSDSAFFARYSWWAVSICFSFSSRYNWQVSVIWS